MPTKSGDLGVSSRYPGDGSIFSSFAAGEYRDIAINGKVKNRNSR